MSASSLFRHLRAWSLRSRPANSTRRVRRPNLRLEGLEDRSVPTATLGISAGVLQFTGTPTSSDVVGISYDTANATYTIRDITQPITYNGVTDNFAYVPAAGFGSIEIDAGNGANVFYIESAVHPIVVNGGADSDTVLVGNDLDNINPSAVNASVTVHGGGGFNSVSASDFGGPSVGHNYSITDAKISRDNVSLVAYDAQVQAVWLNPGVADNVVRVFSTSATAQTQITMQPTGNDVVVVGSNANTLDSIKGILVVAGAESSLGRHDDLVIDDLGNSSGHNYQMGIFGGPGGSAMSLTRDGQLLVSSASIGNYALATGTGDDIVGVNGTATGTNTLVYTGAGADDVEVGDPYRGLDYISGPLTVDGGTAPTFGNTLHFNDAAAAQGHAYLLQATEFDRANGASLEAIKYSNFRTIQIDLTAFNDLLDVVGTPATSVVTANMGAGNDTLVSTTAKNDYYLSQPNQGYMTCVGGMVNFSSAENIQGWTGQDTVHFLSGGSIGGNVTNLVGGNSTLDYSALSKDVKVNLQKHTATAVGGIVSGFENVNGGSGNDLIVGDDKQNILHGGQGNDVMVGGAGLDFMFGEAGDDLMIGGTAFNYEQASLEAVWREWTNTDPNDDFMTKMGHLLFGGGLNGNVRLIPGQTVKFDAFANMISGNGGSNWIWL